MPNILAHTHITALTLGELSPDVLLGATLPDFAGMYKARYGGLVAIRGFSGQLDEGIDFHIRTDSVFDRQTEKPQMTEPLSRELEEAGIAYQAARLSAAFAADVLLDRALLDHEEAIRNFHDLGRGIASGQTALAVGNFEEDFITYVGEYFRDDGPRHYRDNKHVAALIHHRLAARSIQPSKTVSYEQISVLADVIGSQADLVGELGLQALAKTIHGLRQ